MADLGGLGAKAGPEISYQWSPPSTLPRWLPVFALLLLLLPGKNRCRQALWVAAPLAVSLAVLSLIWMIPGFGSDAPDGFFEAFSAVSWGLAAVWLLLPYLSRGHRFLTFLGMVAAMELVSHVFTCVVGLSAAGDEGGADRCIVVAVIGLLLTVVLNLAGWSCRKRHSRNRFLLWLLVWIVAAWLVVFGVMSLIEGPGPLTEMAMALLFACAVTYSLLLPFVVLSFCNSFYRARLEEALRLGAATGCVPKESNGETAGAPGG